jgi:hypothetical protein
MKAGINLSSVIHAVMKPTREDLPDLLPTELDLLGWERDVLGQVYLVSLDNRIAEVSRTHRLIPDRDFLHHHAFLGRELLRRALHHQSVPLRCARHRQSILPKRKKRRELRERERGII